LRPKFKQIHTIGKLLGEIFDIAPVLIMIHDNEGHIHFTNQMAVRAHGYETAKDFLSINLRNLDVPESEALLDERSKYSYEKFPSFRFN
jgi:PAS domain-containing protein